jgi:hypothetical protein
LRREISKEEQHSQEEVFWLMTHISTMLRKREQTEWLGA